MRKGLSLFSQVVGSLLILTLVIIVAMEVIGRSAFGHSFMVANEYSGYIAVMVTFLGIPYAVDKDALLRVNFLVDRLREKPRRGLELAFRLTAISVSGVIGYQLVRMAIKSFERGTFASTPAQTPLWIPQGAMVLGMALLVLMLAVQIIADLRALTRREEK